MCYIRQREREQENKRKKKKRRIICIRQTSAGAKKGGQVRGGRLGASCGKKKSGTNATFTPGRKTSSSSAHTFQASERYRTFSLCLSDGQLHTTTEQKMFDRICIYIYIYPSPSILFVCVCVCVVGSTSTRTPLCVCVSCYQSNITQDLVVRFVIHFFFFFFPHHEKNCCWNWTNEGLPFFFSLIDFNLFEIFSPAKRKKILKKSRDVDV